ncbi:MAG: DUF1156 domain-containing protein [Candidatus Thorarchaeota archaeon]|nr:DUF1156 domain-containing protein [Candidatus Thorarchaeota archaeon]
MFIRILGLDSLKHLIETFFPLSEVNKIAEMESTGFGRRHYRPVYVIHKWWARRLGSIFRSIILYSLIDENLSEKKQKKENLWNYYSQDIQLKGKVVLDPMMGGGTTIVEALKLGCKVVGGDLNPVSWFIVKKTVEDVNPQLLHQTLVNLEQDLGEELRKYYRTICPECGKEAEGIYFFHYKEVPCPKCAKLIPLMHNFFLARGINKNEDYVICPKCWNVFRTKSARNVTKCPNCDEKFVATKRKSANGRQFKCSNSACGTHSIVKTIQKMKKRPSEKLYAIEFYCKYCDDSRNRELKNGRGYKAADKFDLDLLAKAEEEFLRIQEQLPIPDSTIPLGEETKRALNHGYRCFRDMFNSRQLLNLGKIYRWILDITDQNLKEFLILAFSNSLKYNNMFAKYNATRGFITDIFRTHSFSPSLAPVEANCYDMTKGRGAFKSFVELLIEGKEYCRAPFERFFDGNIKKKVILHTKIDGKLAKEYSDFEDGANVLLRCGSSESLPIPDTCIDAVITDPPYFRNVMYSELSNFFYVWLVMGLRESYKEFGLDLVPWQDEVIENTVQQKGQREYVIGLRQILSESRRVLVPDGVLVFTFHHKRIKAWGALMEALLSSGFYVITTYPVRSEMKASTHLHDMENISFDMIFVCKKRERSSKLILWTDLKQAVMQSVSDTIMYLQENDQTMNIPDISAIILGKWVQLYSQYYPNIQYITKRVYPNEAFELIEGDFEDVLTGICKSSL